MVIDFRKLQHDPPTLSINGEVVERESTLILLPGRRNVQPAWLVIEHEAHSKEVLSTELLRQKTKKCYVCRTITNLFYKSTVQSVLCYCRICRGGSLSVKNRVLLDRVVRSASKTIGSTLPTVDELYETYDEKNKGHLKGHFTLIARILLCCTIWL